MWIAICIAGVLLGALAGFVGGLLVFNNNVAKIKKVIDGIEDLAPKKK